MKQPIFFLSYLFVAAQIICTDQEPVFAIQAPFTYQHESRPTFLNATEMRRALVQPSAAYDAYHQALAIKAYNLQLCRAYNIDERWVSDNAQRLETRCTAINFCNGPWLSPQRQAPAQLPQNFREDFSTLWSHPVDAWHGDRGVQQYQTEFAMTLKNKQPQEYALCERAEMRRWCYWRYAGFREHLQQLSVYDTYLPEIAAQLEHDPEFAERIAQINHELPALLKAEQLRVKEKVRTRQQQLIVENNFQTCTQAIAHECKMYYKTTNASSYDRCERRAAAFHALTRDGVQYTSIQHPLQERAAQQLNALALDATTYTTCYGNQLQQVIHSECVTLVEKAAALETTDERYAYQTPLIESIDAAREYNASGNCYHALTIVDVCWSVFDCGIAVLEGAVSGIQHVLTDAMHNPVQTAFTAAAGTYLCAYQLAKMAYAIVRIGTTSVWDPETAQRDWNNYTQPVRDLFASVTDPQLSTRTKLKNATHIGTCLVAQQRLLNSMRTIGSIARARIPVVAPQLQQYAQSTYSAFAKTIHKAKGELKSGGKKNKPAEQPLSATPETPQTPTGQNLPTPQEQTEASSPNLITPAVKAPLSWEEKVEISVKDVMVKNNWKHIFGEDKHLLHLLQAKMSDENIVRAALEAIKDKLPSNGVFRKIKIVIEGYPVEVSGIVLDSVPRIGTLYIPYKEIL